MKFRYDRKGALDSLILPALLYGSLALIVVALIFPKYVLLKHGALVGLGIFAAWRYGWMLLNYSRAFLYARFYYPVLKRKIDALPLHKRYPKYLFFMIPSYREDFWVTAETFRAIFDACVTIPSKVTIVIATGSAKEDALIRKMARAYRHKKEVKLIFMHQNSGKRLAMGHALRAIARIWHKEVTNDPDSVTIFMDGDSYIEKGFLRKLLPFFAISSKIGAVTTNEVAFIDTKNSWYRDWFNLKFGQRHILFQSHALSKKVLTLTGRLSAYRTSIVVEEAFIRQVEHDIILSAIHGKFRFLMGDDKSTWYYLLKHGWEMLYLPDLLCITLESRDGSFLKLSRTLPYRWFGNTLRNNSRALALGPRKTGWFIWYAIFDQRLVMWTSLVGISSAIILSLFVSPWYLLFFLVWIVLVRLFQLFVIALGGHYVSWRSLPLILYTQWVGALVKIRAFYNLSDQNWSKNSDIQSGSKDRVHIDHPLVAVMPKIMMAVGVGSFILLLLLSHGVLRLPDTLAIFLHDRFETVDSSALNAYENHFPISSKMGEGRYEIFHLSKYGVSTSGHRNGAIISSLIAASDPKRHLILILPPGEIPLYQPIVIRRSHVTLTGSAEEDTLLHSFIKGSNKNGVIRVAGKRGRRVGYTTQSIYRNQSAFGIDAPKELTQYLLLRQPNDRSFVHGVLGARNWYRKYPYLRQEIVALLDYDPQKSVLYTKKPVLTDFSGGKSEVIATEMVEDVILKNFTLLQEGPAGKQNSDFHHTYRNLYPDFAADAISLHYAAKCKLQNLKIINSGSDAVECDYCYGLLLENLLIDGSWNKGKKGNGYVRFARTWYSTFRNSEVRHIRHVTLQWSSAGNHLYNLLLGVDLNLHGGFAHENRIDHIRFEIPPEHRWKPIETCPPDAHWAPPDGPNTIDTGTLEIVAPKKENR